jgi:SAM-dependent methyltransferase
MSIDIRYDAAKYYDYNPNAPNDIPFYMEKIPSPSARLLELGCGTGRVTIPLSQQCSFIQGIDLSQAMIAICRDKLAKEDIPATKARADVGDITDLDLKQKFDLIIAPYRVFQNLETDSEVKGLFSCARRHLATDGTCILNVFKPYKDREILMREWCTNEENLAWEIKTADGKVACYDRRPRLDADKLILYPELIYRRYENDVVVDQAILKIVMRCYYPEEFLDLITAHGFSIKSTWGGYAGEEYGQGPELVVEFGEGA